jgi:hypothetical protein
MIENDPLQDDPMEVADDDTPVSSRLADFDLPDFSEELAVWRTHCHELWNSAALAGDLRAQAASLQAAYRGLAEWSNALEAEKIASAQGGISQETKDKIILDFLDGMVSASRETLEQCPLCTGWGDAGRVHAFTSWLAEKGLSSEFETWVSTTPRTWASSRKKRGEHENGRTN